MILENLKRAYYEDGDELSVLNSNAKPCGQFKKLNKDIFYKFVAPVARYYRKSPIYDDARPVIFHMTYGIFRKYVIIGVSWDGEDIDYTLDVSIPKKASDRDIDEYAYSLISRLVDRR